MDVSENSGTPKSSILIGFSIINHPFWGNPIFGNARMLYILGMPMLAYVWQLVKEFWAGNLLQIDCRLDQVRSGRGWWWGCGWGWGWGWGWWWWWWWWGWGWWWWGWGWAWGWWWGWWWWWWWWWWWIWWWWWWWWWGWWGWGCGWGWGWGWGWWWWWWWWWGWGWWWWGWGWAWGWWWGWWWWWWWWWWWIWWWWWWWWWMEQTPCTHISADVLGRMITAYTVWDPCMVGMFTYIWLVFLWNVGKYTIHWIMDPMPSYGYWRGSLFPGAAFVASFQCNNFLFGWVIWRIKSYLL